jgi:hypothetical protein
MGYDLSCGFALQQSFDVGSILIRSLFTLYDSGDGAKDSCCCFSLSQHGPGVIPLSLRMTLERCCFYFGVMGAPTGVLLAVLFSSECP